MASTCRPRAFGSDLPTGSGQARGSLQSGLVFIMDDHDNFPSLMMTQNNIFPCWRMIRYSSHLMGDFISLS